MSTAEEDEKTISGIHRRWFFQINCNSGDEGKLLLIRRAIESILSADPTTVIIERSMMVKLEDTPQGHVFHQPSGDLNSVN